VLSLKTAETLDASTEGSPIGPPHPTEVVLKMVSVLP
jgi:hypothetical protein